MESTAATAPLVRVDKVSKHFGEGDTRVDALHEVSISVDPGEVVVFPVGRRGSNCFR